MSYIYIYIYLSLYIYIYICWDVVLVTTSARPRVAACPRASIRAHPSNARAHPVPPVGNIMSHAHARA